MLFTFVLNIDTNHLKSCTLRVELKPEPELSLGGGVVWLIGHTFILKFDWLAPSERWDLGLNKQFAKYFWMCIIFFYIPRTFGGAVSFKLLKE